MVEQMHNPVHPGEVLRELCMEALELSVTDAATDLGVSPKHCLQYSMEGRASVLRWRSGYSWHLARLPRAC